MKMNLEASTYNRYDVIDEVKFLLDFTNKRIKIVDFPIISVKILKKIINIGIENSMGKIICNSKETFVDIFNQCGFTVEGKIDGFFKGEDAICLSYFIEETRMIKNNYDKEEDIIRECLSSKKKYLKNKDDFIIRNATKNDIDEIINLFSDVFVTYPSPVCNRNFLETSMNANVIYKVAIKDNKIIGIASADMDNKNLNAKITDCAIFPKYRGLGVLSNIIDELEKDLKDIKFITLYSLSRAVNPSINHILKKHNYEFRGRLINNCNICGGFENMNIWVKNI